MCLILFGGANHFLPLIPADNDNLDFHAIELIPEDKFVEVIIHKSFIRYFGTSEGCGCLFNVGRDYAENQYEKEEVDAANKMILKLVDFLSQNSVEILYSCWDGQKYTDLPKTREISIEDISKKEFVFQENELLQII